MENAIGFTGRHLDSETGLYYFRARYYDTEQGRFISRDPAGYVDGMGLYNGYFAWGFAMDPSGRITTDQMILACQLARFRCENRCNRLFFFCPPVLIVCRFSCITKEQACVQDALNNS